TAANFACGTEIEFDLNLTFPNGSKTIQITLPTCTGGADQTIPANVLDANDPTQLDRLGRDGQPSGCGGKVCPGGGFPGTKRFQTFNFTNNSAAAGCFTVTINAALGGAGDIESAAYLGTYDPTNLCLNYLGDSGVVGLGTTLGSASYSFTVPAEAQFVVVVNTTGRLRRRRSSAARFPASSTIRRDLARVRHRSLRSKSLWGVSARLDLRAA